MGPPFSILPRLRWSRVRGVENPRTARLVHHINSDGPRALIIESTGGSPHESAIAAGRRRSGRSRGVVCVFAKTDAGARPSVLLHAPDARAHVELRALALEVRVAVDAALVGQLHALLGALAALHALCLSQAVQ